MSKAQQVDEFAETLVLPSDQKARAARNEGADQQDLYSEYVQELERELKPPSRRR